MANTTVANSDGLYLGLMSGTSVDGVVDAALIRRTGAAVKLVGAELVSYSSDLRAALRGLASGEGGIEALGRADAQVGNAFSAAAMTLLENCGVAAEDVRAIGSHGQTVLHRPDLGISLQIGDGARIAQSTGITTVNDFRRADLAAGGEGAPLTPTFHRAVFASLEQARAVLNLGGIANLTVLHPGQPVHAFDVGPANTLLDALARETTAADCDRDGALAASGRVSEALLEALLADSWFARPPPKSTGPEYFNLDWVRTHEAAQGIDARHLAATLAELTAASVAQALAGRPVARLYCCGGGVHNPELMRRLAADLPGIDVTSTAELGADPDFVEAMCFAWLAGETLAGRPGNLAEVTGARCPAVLGAIHHP
ncbi:MAG: anhydro-N-acetylmuramic acid kinase [Gammaproteobacteria bacterium]|nr:anhydro-N-acetylmuramic acid kinase [Gammaproteobacteria bacterium]